MLMLQSVIVGTWVLNGVEVCTRLLFAIRFVFSTLCLHKDDAFFGSVMEK